MAKQEINIGTGLNDPNAESVRSAFSKAISNFDELYEFLAEPIQQTIITSNSTTFNGTQKGKNKIYPFAGTQNQELFIDAAYANDDFINILNDSPEFDLEIKRLNATRLTGVRDIDNKFIVPPHTMITLIGKGSNVLIIVGGQNRGYTGAVTTSSYSPLQNTGVAQDITVIGTGFSANMQDPVLTGNATLNSWTYVNPNQITLNITETGAVNDTITVTYDNGDITVDTDAITIIAGITILFQDDFTGTTINTSNWTVTNPDSADLTISQNDKLLFTRTTDNAVPAVSTNNLTSVNSYAKGGAVSAVLNQETGYTVSNRSLFWKFDANNMARISKAPGGTTAQLIVFAAGVLELNVDSGVSINNRFKITYETNNDIKFWYWNTNQWTQMGTTQNFDLGANLFVELNSASDVGDAVNDQLSFDEVRVTDTDYTTELP